MTTFSQEHFAERTAPLEKELMLHCYRFMGSLQDSEDMLQEAMLKAWNRRESLKSGESFRAWMYKISTNVCLDQLKKQKRRGMPHQQASPADPLTPLPAPIGEPIWLEPFPDVLLPSQNDQPEKITSVNEEISLAFMTAIHLLPPQQRAVLILMDVLDWSAKETAYALDTTVSSVNSVLYRARKKLKQKRNDPINDWPQESKLSNLLDQYIQSWENLDIEKLTALLKEDAIFYMPPFPSWYQGRDAIKTMVSTHLFTGQFQASRKFTLTHANQQPAIAVYELDSDTQAYNASAIIVLAIQDNKITEMVAFLNPAIFPYFNLPLVREIS